MGRGAAASDFAIAAAWLQPFTLYVVALLVLAPPTDAQWAHADPILGILPRAVTLASAPVLGVALAIAWLAATRPSRAAIVASAKHAAAGAAIAIVLVGVLRAVVGPRLPSFIPPEESAGPGLLLGMTAGFDEEALFRAMLVPAVFFAARRARGRVAIATIATGLAFALLHEAGPAPSSAVWFVTRAIVPGCAFTAACFAVSPTFIVVAHCAAHVLIPLAFAG